MTTRVAALTLMVCLLGSFGFTQVKSTFTQSTEKASKENKTKQTSEKTKVQKTKPNAPAKEARTQEDEDFEKILMGIYG
jgi:hypothetical protein